VAVGIATRYKLHCPGIESQGGGGEFFLVHPGRPGSPPSILFNVYQVFRRVKRPEAVDEHPPPFIAEVFNAHSCSSAFSDFPFRAL
jgi:hypothetical protein